MKHLALLNPEEATEEEAKHYPVRHASRAIVIDSDGKIALLYVGKMKYYKLPGGGIDAGEDRLAALHRECKEEIGCNIEVLEEVGVIVEYRKMFRLKQISYCYLAKARGQKGAPNFTDEEMQNGFENVWITYEEALRMVKKGTGEDDEGKLYISHRDSIFLEEAKNYVSKY